MNWCELGIGWMWLGLESPQLGLCKLSGTDSMTLCRELQQNGIKLLGSTIIGLEHHTPQNIHQEIEHAVSHGTDFHQFMLYTPVPGTPLYEQIQSEGRLLDVNLADIHGQHKFNFEHAAISRDESKQYLDEAFQRDFEMNGPSLFRICRTTLEGWRRHRNHPDARVRERFTREFAMLRNSWIGILWAMERQLRASNDTVSRRIRELRADILRECGGINARLASAVVGPLMLWAAKMERMRLRKGITYEPAMIVQHWPPA